MTFYPQKYKYTGYSRHLDWLIIWEICC